MGGGQSLGRSQHCRRKAGASLVKQVISQGKNRIERGLWLTIFPEGTRMPPGETKRYGVSGAAVAAETGCPVVPVAHNAGDFWPKRGLRKYPGKIRFCIGPTIDPAGRTPKEEKSLPDFNALLGRQVQRVTFLYVKRLVEFRHVACAAVRAVHARGVRIRLY